MDDLIVKEHLERLLSGHSKQQSKVLVFHEKNFRCISAKSIIFFILRMMQLKRNNLVWVLELTPY